MAGLGSVAYDYYDNAQERPVEHAAPRRFEVVEGGGLDARAREGVSAATWRAFKAVIATALAIALVGVGRVALLTATAANLQEAAGMTQTISSVESANADLLIERSVLSSNARINAIATEVYGMSRPGSDVTADEAQDASAEAQAQATGDVQTESPTA